MSDSSPTHESIDLEDLADLASADLRAVFHEVGSERVILALADAPPALRRRLLKRWGPAGPDARTIPLNPSDDQVRWARRALLDAVCRLSRVGLIAFDHPDDILDQVA